MEVSEGLGGGREDGEVNIQGVEWRWFGRRVFAVWGRAVWGKVGEQLRNPIDLKIMCASQANAARVGGHRREKSQAGELEVRG